MANDAGLFTNGSLWVRSDFHLHTRRDKEFKDPGDERDFVTRYVAALKAANIRVGIITNHNKFDCSEFLALRKTALKEDIFLLPGLELSVKDGANGIHTLVVFKEDWVMNLEKKDYINDFLTVTFAGQANYENSNARSNDDLLETLRELDNFQRDYFIAFAHVEADNGLWGALKGGRLTELGQSELLRTRTLAFQKVRSRDIKRKVQAWLGGWYPSEVEGSDPKSMDEIGRGEQTFLKIGAFTFEAVQFALKPGTERVSAKAPPARTHSWVRSIRFEGGVFDGKRFDFSDQLNCLIGIRGSGKSAVLETLRYGLELPLDEGGEDAKYKQELVRFTLRSGGKVIVEADDAQGNRYEIRRILNERADVYFEDQLRPGVRITTVVKNPLFFGQKELVRRAEGFERDLVERLLGSKLDGVRREIAAQRQKVLDVLSNLNKLKDLDVLEQEYQTKRKDAEFQLELFRKYGVEEQLRRQVEFNADVTHAKQTVDAGDAFLRATEAFLAEQEAELAAHARMESRANADLAEDFNNIFSRIQQVPTRIRQLLAEARQDAATLRERFGAFEQRRTALKEEFAAIERQLSTQLQQQGTLSVRPDDFVRLNAELQKADLALKEVARGKARKGTLRDELTKEMRLLSDLWHREFKQIEGELKKLNESQAALHLEVEYKGDKEAFLKQLQGHFRGSRLREATLDAVVRQHPDFVAIYGALDGLCAGMGDSGDVFRKYFNEAKTSLLTWQVPNRFKIHYHGKELGEHSLGQRASALILFVLSQRDNDVLAIDQPEDDLDNQTIFEDVIKLLRSLRCEVQFIFATHNANFPVLGDADQVGACSFTGGQGDIKAGSIDEPEIQRAIVSIMEGGREAFARRKEIYQLWKQ